MDGYEQVSYDAAMHPHPARAQTRPGSVPTQDDLARLRQEHPGWTFESVWITVNSGPDRRLILASRNGVMLTAWTAAELAADINRESVSDRTQEEGISP